MFKLAVDKEIDLVFLQKSMAPQLYTLVDKNREYLRIWLPWVEDTRSVTDIESFIERSIAGFARGEELVCGIEYRENLTGVISFNSISEALKKATLGYWLSSELQGNGIITRCCKKMIRYAFTEMKMEKVEIRVATENASSRKVCERLGCSLEGVISNSENDNGRIVDHAVYACFNTKKYLNELNDAYISE